MDRDKYDDALLLLLERIALALEQLEKNTRR
jgi:hypothetical protein